MIRADSVSRVKMYKSRIWKWGLDKKLKGDEVLAILLLKRERDAVDKRSEFRIRGQLVDLDNVNRYLKRNPSLMARYRSGQKPSIQTTLEVYCQTPPPSPTLTIAHIPGEMHQVEQILTLYRDYVDGCFGAGKWTCQYDVDCVSVGGGDRSGDLFERVIASFALVNRCMMRGDNISINSLLGPAFESLKEIVASESPIFVARTVCLLWYLERHHKHDLLRLVMDYLSGLVPIVLGHHHIMTQIWRLLGGSELSDYYELSLRLYAMLIPDMEDRVGSANYLTHVLYSDYIDCLYARQTAEECESVIRRHREKAEATGKRHEWLDDLALSHAGLLVVCKQGQGRVEEAIQVLTSHRDHYAHTMSEEQEALLNLELGVTYYKCGNLTAAIPCVKQAARLALISDADERIVLTSLANLERMLRETGRTFEADRALQFHMQRVGAFAEKSGSIANGLDFDEDVEPIDRRDSVEFDLPGDLPDWLWLDEGDTEPDHDEAQWLSVPECHFHMEDSGSEYSSVYPCVPTTDWNSMSASPPIISTAGVSPLGHPRRSPSASIPCVPISGP
jgi:tetratricopeptide (TPR) repeat protein